MGQTDKFLVFLINIDLKRRHKLANWEYKQFREFLNDPRVDPSVAHNYAIQVASRFGLYNFVRLILQDDRVDPSDDDNKAVQLAYTNRHWGVFKLLCQDRRVSVSVM